MADIDPFVDTRRQLRQALDTVRGQEAQASGEPADRFRIASDRILEAIILLTPSVSNALNNTPSAPEWTNQPITRTDLQGIDKLRTPGSPAPSTTDMPDDQAIEAAFTSVLHQWPTQRGNMDRARALWFKAAKQVGLRTLMGSVNTYLRSEAGTESDYIKSLQTFLGVPELYSQGDDNGGAVSPMMAARKWVDQHALDADVPTVAMVAQVVRENPEVDAQHMGDFLTQHYRLGEKPGRPSSGRMGYRGKRRHVAAGAFIKEPPTVDGVEADGASDTPSDAPERQSTGEEDK